METLAINGGTPVRKEKIFYGRQWIDEEDISSVADVLRSDFITCGPKVTQLEEELCALTGAKYCVAVNSGTSALHCATITAGLKPGDELITTPLTFAASANSALYVGATPVFADVNPDIYNIDPESIRRNLTERTRAIVAVDFTGQVVQVEEIRNICKEAENKYGHKVFFIEDAAHSIGTKYKGQPVGSMADMTCLSFHPVKTVTGGEGGAILTNDEDLYKKLVLAHTHGITHEEKQMEGAPHEGPWYYEMISLGYNYRLTDFQAALISSQLKKIDGFIKRRKEIVRRYNEAFSAMPELIVQQEIPESDSCRHLYILRLNLEKLKCSRREFFDAMSAENVQCQVHYVPVYWFPYYQHMGYRKGLCPNAEEIYKGIMSIPLYPKMTDQDVTDVIKAVKKVVENYKK